MDCRILGNESSSRAAVSISLCSAVFGNLSPTLSKSFPTFRLASIALSISPHLCYCYSFLRSFVCWLDCKFVRFNPLARGSSHSTAGTLGWLYLILRASPKLSNSLRKIHNSRPRISAERAQLSQEPVPSMRLPGKTKSGGLPANRWASASSACATSPADA